MNRLRGWLGRFALVGGLATILDIGVFLATKRALGWPVVVADLVAVTVAAVFAYSANRLVTFRNDPFVRWVHQPAAFVGVAMIAALVDLGVLRFGLWLGASLFVAKIVAVAVAASVRVVGYRWALFQGVRRRQGARRPDRAPAPGDVRFSVVIPAFREEERIAETVASLRVALADVAADGGAEIVIVDDGSGDGTVERAKLAASAVDPTLAAAASVVVLAQPENRGKGAAVRAGMLAAKGRAVAFTDADLAYSPDQLLLLLDQVEQGWDMVVGSRHHRGATTLVRAGRVRELGSRVINLFTLALLLGQYRDTQCGLKAFRSDVARSMFSRSRVDGFAFDVELFHLAERDEISLVEVPAQVANSERSTVKVARDAYRLVIDLLRIRRWAKQGWYEQAAPALAQPPSDTARHSDSSLVEP